MNVLVLAAGYATRLHPLTKNTAKPLLEVAGRPMMDWVMTSLEGIRDINRIVVVTNDRFFKDFQAWVVGARNYWPYRNIEVLNDGSTSQDDRLGAIGDMQFAIDAAGLLEEDLFVVAGDNLFSLSQNAFVDFARNKPATIATREMETPEAVSNLASVETDDNRQITFFVEKPEAPRSNTAGIALYYFRSETIPQVRQYLEEGYHADNAGFLFAWLYQKNPTFAFPIEGEWYDIGSKEHLATANAHFLKLFKRELCYEQES